MSQLSVRRKAILVNNWGTQQVPRSNCCKLLWWKVWKACMHMLQKMLRGSLSSGLAQSFAHLHWTSYLITTFIRIKLNIICQHRKPTNQAWCDPLPASFRGQSCNTTTLDAQLSCHNAKFYTFRNIIRPRGSATTLHNYLSKYFSLLLATVAQCPDKKLVMTLKLFLLCKNNFLFNFDVLAVRTIIQKVLGSIKKIFPIGSPISISDMKKCITYSEVAYYNIFS